MIAVFLIAFTLVAGQDAGSTTSELTGKVIIPHEQVNFSTPTIGLETMQRHRVDQAFLDLTGSFVFRNVVAGNYYLCVYMPGMTEFCDVVRVPTFREVQIDLTRSVATESYTPLDGFHTADVSELELPQKAVNKYEDGLWHFRHGDLDDAIEDLQSAVTLAPDYYRAHLWLARIYQRVGRLKDAEQEFRIAGELGANAADPFLELGVMLLSHAKYEQAIEALRSALIRDSRSGAAAYHLGAALFFVGQYEEAEQALGTAQILLPLIPAVRLMLINVSLKLQRFDEIMNHIEAYLSEFPSDEKRQDVIELKNRLETMRP